MFRRVASKKLIDFYEALTATFIRAISLVMEAVDTSEAVVSFHETTRHCFPEDIVWKALQV
jgi:hypothetical protein